MQDTSDSTVSPGGISLTKFKQLAAQARREWLQNFVNEDAIKKTTFDRLDAQFSKLLCHYLDFEKAAQGAQRRGVSPVVTFVLEAARKAVESWTESNKDSLPVLPETAVADLRKHYLEEYHKLLKINLERLAEKRANEDAQEIVNSSTDIFGD